MAYIMQVFEFSASSERSAPMPGRVAKAVSVTPCQREILERIIRAHQSSQAHVIRARIILYAADGLINEQIAACLSLTRQCVSIWRSRWAAAFAVLCRIEDEEDERGLKKHIEKVLSDAPRPGMPPKFGAEQVCQIIAVSCEKPADCGHPISHWTPQALRLEVLKRGLVSSISVRQVGRFLKRSRHQAPSAAVLGDIPG
jgi:putative transposase